MPPAEERAQIGPRDRPTARPPVRSWPRTNRPGRRGSAPARTDCRLPPRFAGEHAGVIERHHGAPRGAAGVARRRRGRAAAARTTECRPSAPISRSPRRTPAVGEARPRRRRRVLDHLGAGSPEYVIADAGTAAWSTASRSARWTTMTGTPRSRRSSSAETGGEHATVGCAQAAALVRQAARVERPSRARGDRGRESRWPRAKCRRRLRGFAAARSKTSTSSPALRERNRGGKAADAGADNQRPAHTRSA